MPQSERSGPLRAAWLVTFVMIEIVAVPLALTPLVVGDRITETIGQLELAGTRIRGPWVVSARPLEVVTLVAHEEHRLTIGIVIVPHEIGDVDGERLPGKLVETAAERQRRCVWRRRGRELNHDVVDENRDNWARDFATALRFSLL